MKKSIYIYAAIAAALVPAGTFCHAEAKDNPGYKAQPGTKPPYSIIRSEFTAGKDSLRISMDLTAEGLSPDWSLLLTPVASDDLTGRSIRLSPVLLSGKRKAMSLRRKEIFSQRNTLTRKGMSSSEETSSGKEILSSKGMSSEKEKLSNKGTFSIEEMSPDRGMPSGKEAHSRKKTVSREDTIFSTDTLAYRDTAGQENTGMKIYPAGDTVRYSVSLPINIWIDRDTLSYEKAADTLLMPSAVNISITAMLEGCCRSIPVEPVYAGNAALPRPVILPPPPAVPVLSPVEMLAQQTGYILPMSEYGKGKDNRGLTVYFRRDRHVIDSSYMDNGESIRKFTEAIETFAKDSSVTLSRLTVTGYASIEGPAAYNTRLAAKRAEKLKDTAVQLGVPPDSVEIINMGEGWDELEELITETDSIPHKDEILHIIRTVPVSGGRETMLMKIDGGKPYRWMLEHLFPMQRHAGYIRMYYSPVSETGHGDRTAPESSEMKGPASAETKETSKTGHGDRTAPASPEMKKPAPQKTQEKKLNGNQKQLI